MSKKRRRFATSQKAAIVMEVLKEEKSIAEIAAENGVHPNQIHKWKKQALTNFSQLFEDGHQSEKAQAAEHEKRLNNLYAEIGRLSAQLTWLKKNLACRNRAERLVMLETDHPELSLKVQAELLEISYSSLFYKPVPPSERELAIKRRIDEVYTAHPMARTGSPKSSGLNLGWLALRSSGTCEKWVFSPWFPVRIRANPRPNIRSSRTCCGVSPPSIPTTSGI